MSSDPSRPSGNNVVFPGGSADSRTGWKAIAAGTAVAQFSYWPAVSAVVGAPDSGADGTRMLTLGFAVMPLVFITVAFGSRHPRAPAAVLRAMGLFIVVGLPLALWHVGVGLVVGYGAGTIAALRRPERIRSHVGRVVAVTLAGVYVFIAGAVATSVGLLAGALVALAAVGVADAVAVRRGGDADSRDNNLRSP